VGWAGLRGGRGIGSRGGRKGSSGRILREEKRHNKGEPLQALQPRFHVTGTVTDAHGVDANSVGATAHSHTDSENRSQRLSQSVTVPNGYPVTLTVPCAPQ